MVKYLNVWVYEERINRQSEARLKKYCDNFEDAIALYEKAKSMSIDVGGKVVYENVVGQNYLAVTVNGAYNHILTICRLTA